MSYIHELLDGSEYGPGGSMRWRPDGPKRPIWTHLPSGQPSVQAVEIQVSIETQVSPEEFSIT